MAYVRQPREHEYPRLLERAVQCLPNSTTVVGTLEIFTNPEIPKFSKLKLWIPNESESLPFFIVITNSEKFQSLLPYWDPGSMEQSILVSLLSSIPDFNWRKFIRLYTVAEPVLRELAILMESEGLSGSSLQRIMYARGAVFKCSLENVPYIPLLPNCELREISLKDITFVEEHWEHTKENPAGILNFAITNLGSSAVYTDDPITNGKPISWTIFRQDSQIGATYTHPKFRGNQLASIVTVDLLDKMLKKGFHPYVLITNANLISRRFHERIGFENVSSVGWDYYVPTDGNGTPETLKPFLK